jgi:aminoglycoside phosphotransferase (APT) family kinase protein
MKKRPAVTARTAALVLEHHFGKRPQTVQRIHGGVTNHVFAARIGTEDLVLRISQKPAKLQKFMKEQWAVSAARKNNVPTPQILEVCNDVIDLPYMISRKVLGQSAGTMGHSRTAVLRELGEYAARINAIPTHDFGHIFDWSPNKLSRHRTWTDYLDNELHVAERLEIFQRAGVILPGNLKKLRRQLQSMRAWKPTPTLSHGDIRLKNVMLNERQKIVAILDWENCTSNVAPWWELSISLHDLTMDEKQSFLDGYGLPLKDYMQMAPAIKALNLLNYADVVTRATKRKDRVRLLNLRVRLNGAFDLYSL